MNTSTHSAAGRDTTLLRSRIMGSSLVMRRSLFMATLLVLGMVAVYLSDARVAKVRDHEAPLVLPGFSSDQVRQITVEVLNGTGPYSLQRKANDDPYSSLGSWGLVGVEGAILVQPVIDEMLSALAELRGENFIDLAEGDPEQHPAQLRSSGLEKSPVLSVTVEQGGEVRKVVFGDRHPVSGRRYAQMIPAARSGVVDRNAQRIVLVQEELFAKLNRQIVDVRDSQPLAELATTVRRVELVIAAAGVGTDSGLVKDVTRDAAGRQVLIEVVQERGGNIGLSAKGERRVWRYSSGAEGFEADPQFVEELIHGVFSGPVKGFIDPPARRQIEPASIRATLTVEQDDPALQRFGIKTGSKLQLGFGRLGAVQPGGGGEVDEHAAYMRIADLPTVYQIDHRVLSLLASPTEHYLHRSPFAKLKSEQIDEIVIRRGPSATDGVKLVRHIGADRGAESSTASSRGWELERTGVKLPIGADQLDSLLNQLIALQVINYFAPGELGGELSGPKGPEVLGIVNPFLEIEFWVKSGADRQRQKVVVGNPVDPDEAVDRSKGAPRYGALRRDNGRFVIMLLSSADWVELYQLSERFFTAAQRA